MRWLVDAGVHEETKHSFAVINSSCAQLVQNLYYIFFVILSRWAGKISLMDERDETFENIDRYTYIYHSLFVFEVNCLRNCERWHCFIWGRWCRRDFWIICFLGRILWWEYLSLWASIYIDNFWYGCDGIAEANTIESYNKLWLFVCRMVGRC